MAPTTDKPVLTFEDLETETAIALPERELMCASSCGGLLSINAQICVTANVNLGCTNICTGVYAGAYVH